MLPSSVRRVVSSAPPAAAGLASIAVPRAAAATSASKPVVMRGHQRRFSSSKPSRSDNGSNEFSAGQSSVPASSRHEGKASGDKRKRKNKDSSRGDASFKKLPSVPATHHMSHEGTMKSVVSRWLGSPSLRGYIPSPGLHIDNRRRTRMRTDMF